MICPASVPVSVELCPAQSSAIANRIGASLVPRKPGEQLVRLLDARHLDAVRVERPPRARTRIAALTKNARSARSPSRSGCTGTPRVPLAASCRSAASAPAPSAGRGCAASPSRPGCRSRRTAAPGRAGSGTKPPAIAAPRSGCARKISTRKQAPIVATSDEDERLHLAHARAAGSPAAGTMSKRRDQAPPEQRHAPNRQLQGDDVPSTSARSQRGDRDLGQEPEHQR